MFEASPRRPAGIHPVARMRNTAKAKDEALAWYHRYRDLRLRLALVGGALALGVALIAALGRAVLFIDPGPGSPIGDALRTDRHVAVLIQTLEPYLPSLNRDHSRNRYSVSLFLVPLDGSRTRQVLLKEGLAPNSYSLARLINSDGQSIWYNVAGIGAVDLRTYKPLPVDRLGEPPARQRTSDFSPDPDVEHHLAAGMYTSPTRWFGLHSPAEAQRDLKLGLSRQRVMHAEHAQQLRRFHQAEVQPDDDTGRHRILSVRPLGDEEYLNAALLRTHSSAEPLRLADPPGALMVYTSGRGLGSTLILARVDLDGKVLWSTDTGIDRFSLLQILPGEGLTAFVGPRPSEPGRVPEPLLVIVEHEAGKPTTHSLWR